MANKKQRHYQSGNPARRAAGAPSPARAQQQSAGTSETRSLLNRVSAPILLAMHALPRWVVPVIMGLLLAGGLFLSGPWNWLGAVLLGLVTLIVLWLYVLSWPVLPPAGRVGRALVVIGLAGITVVKAMGKL